ncbi:Transmembrane protein 156 [Myotis brandtii]|uniref:Transmembrane protein 156 n=1 Tax=Myotis brandtii TaxID=109478 RepID=S7NCA0_MYOBR|nr:Transmembrane protein 156 [Myotis brandtii]
MMGIFLNHSNFQNFTRICPDITSEFQMCSSCLVCESKGNMDFISQEQTSKVLIMRGSMEVKANDLSPCRHFNFTVAPAVDHSEEYNITCHLRTGTRSSAMMEEEPTTEKSIDHTCGIMNHSNNCVHISLHLEMDVKRAKQRLPSTQVKVVLSPIPELEVPSTTHQHKQYTRNALVYGIINTVESYSYWSFVGSNKCMLAAA